MVNDWIRRGEKIVAYVKEVNTEGKWIEYRIGFYKLLENFPYKEFTAIKTKQKINEYESRKDNVECLIVGEQLIFDSDDEDEYVLMDVNYNEVGELPKSAINYINKKDYKDTVALVSDLEEKLKFKIYKI